MWQGMAITGRCAIDGIADCSGNAFSIAGSIGMSLFASFGNELSYEDVIQLDGAFAATHVNYGKAPLFNGAPHEDSNWESRKEFIFSSGLSIEETVERIRSVDGTATDTSDARSICGSASPRCQSTTPASASPPTGCCRHTSRTATPPTRRTCPRRS